MTAVDPPSISTSDVATILIVEDSPIDRWRVKAIVDRQLGWPTLYAESGTEALEILAANAVDIILTDLQLPELDGLGLVQAVQERELGIPVVLMTGFGSEQVAMQALRCGAASYVPKSALIIDLPATLERVWASQLALRKRKRVEQSLVRAELEYELDNDSSCVAALVNSVRESLMSLGLCAVSRAIRAGVALEEAMLNGIYHGNLGVSSELRQGSDEKPFLDEIERRRKLEPYRSRRLSVIVRADRETATIVIRDEGAGFDVANLADPTDFENLSRVGGRGLLLMRTFMDEVHHNATGNEVTMVLRRQAERASRHGD